MKEKVEKKTKKEKEAEFLENLDQQRRTREMESDIEMRVMQSYATIEHQPYSMNQLNKITDEWVKRRIIY